MNRVIISGNLTRDAELRSTASGMSVLTIGLAVNDRRKNQQTGEWEDYPNFIDCTMFGTRAQNLSQYLAKGAKVTIEGKLHQSRWKTQDGQSRSKVDVTVDNIEFASPSKSTTPRQQSAQQQPVQQPAQQSAQDLYAKDLPF